MFSWVINCNLRCNKNVFQELGKDAKGSDAPTKGLGLSAFPVALQFPERKK